MTYSITLDGNGAAPEDVQGIFEDTVRALRAVGSTVTGTLTGAGDLSAVEVTDAPLDDQGDTTTVDG